MRAVMLGTWKTKQRRKSSEFIKIPKFLEIVVLTFGDKEIRDIKELREAVQDEDNLEKIKEYLNDTSIYNWLDQHYYEREADAVSEISTRQKDWPQRLAKALGTSYRPLTDTIYREREGYGKRKLAVLEAAGSDADLVPKNVNMVALNQEELVSLLNMEEKKIYLCQGSFAIPFSVQGVHYVGLNHPVIEDAFTKEQYRKAGIKIENIDLPDSVDEERSNYALEKAMENGYEPFFEQHSPLANAVHRRLYNIEYGAQSEDGIIENLVLFYDNMLQGHFASFEDELQEYCKSAGKQEVYEQVKEIVRNCKTVMQQVLREELEENRNYYEMYKSECSGNQMGVHELTKGFYESAQRCFREIVSDMEGCMDLLGRELEPMTDKESIGEYLERMVKQTD